MSLQDSKTLRGALMRIRHSFDLSATAIACLFAASVAFAGEQEFAGSYQLVSATRKILETGRTEDTFGKKPKGLAMYGSDGHFTILITYDGRPKPESIEKMTDQQRADLHRTMTAYGGTHTFDGSKVVHHLDLSWNEVWAGTTNIRDIQWDGDQVIYTTRLKACDFVAVARYPRRRIRARFCHQHDELIICRAITCWLVMSRTGAVSAQSV
jgi:hypothetical protein